MIKIDQLKLPAEHTEKDLEAAVSRYLKKAGLGDRQWPYRILRRSLDCRKKPDIFYSYQIGVFPEGADPAGSGSDRDRSGTEALLQKRDRHHRLTFTDPPVSYSVLPVDKDRLSSFSGKPPVVIGDGPAGLFCAYVLTLAGMPPVVLERGEPVGTRTEKVDAFWRDGTLDPDCNVQFGEGGAGTFSDGKLNSSIKDRSGRTGFVLNTFVSFGADPSILYEAKPHLGTDVLKRVIAALRSDMERKGCEFRFGARAEELLLQGGRVSGVLVKEKEALPYSLFSDCVVLAAGHSARDTFFALHDQGVPMEQKPFAMGFRVIHPQRLIDKAQYGIENARERGLPAADYKLTFQAADGRAVYSFCMCPGGYVVNASSEPGRLTVNGMSYSGRSSGYANAAVVAAVLPEDFGSSDPLAGVLLQRRIEEKACSLLQGKIPAQCYLDFKQGTQKALKALPYEPAIKGQYGLSGLRGLFPEKVDQAISEAMADFDRRIPGFAGREAVLAGLEARTSCPLRIVRDPESLMSSFRGLYPCGEGAGYAGGIMSAAVDGIRVAERILA